MSIKNKAEKTYFDRVHSWGRISSVTALCVLLMFPLAICIDLNVWPSSYGTSFGHF